MTHGDIKIVGVPEEEHASFWLHAYHDGHIDEAYEALCTIPQWIVQRALLENFRMDMAEKHERFEKLGRLGPWQLRMMQMDLVEKNGEFDENQFYKEWKAFNGVSLSYCSPESIASYMIQRNWDLWTPIREEDAPWHTLGQQPDLLVVCDSEGYDIYPSEEINNLYEDVKLENVRINFSEDLCEAFKQELMRMVNI